jgi:hypothetical protein
VEPISIIVVLAFWAIAVFMVQRLRHARRIREARESWTEYCRVDVPQSVTLWDDCRAQCEGASVTRER